MCHSLLNRNCGTVITAGAPQCLDVGEQPPLKSYKKSKLYVLPSNDTVLSKQNGGGRGRGTSLSRQRWETTTRPPRSHGWAE